MALYAHVVTNPTYESLAREGAKVKGRRGKIEPWYNQVHEEQ